MNTDVIYVKKINDRWRVWLGREGESDPKPAKCDARFLYYRDALVYAYDWRDFSYIPKVIDLREIG